MPQYSLTDPPVGRQLNSLVFLTLILTVTFLVVQGKIAAQSPLAETSPTPAAQEDPATPDTASEPVEATPSNLQPQPATSATENQPSTQSAAASEATADGNDQSIEISENWKRLGKNEIWINFKSKQVMLGGNICLTAGGLEMFVCPANTKEHESVIAANAKASELHAALVALGADPGKPCQWDPKYKPATGPIIDINIAWHDPQTKQTITRPAREMIRDFHTKKPMTQQWVFGGSELWEDPATGDQIYYANSGEMICVSNFSTATMDLNVESSQSNDGLLFEAFTENIPPLGTKVYVILKPGKRIESK